MENFRSWKFWIVVALTAGIGTVPMFLGPLWLGGIVLLATLGVFVFYLKCEFGTFPVPWFANLGMFGGYKGEEIPEKPGPVFRGLAWGSLLIWLIPVIVKLVRN